nr:GNAT family N-acetyltransferase [Spirochaeta isovalerica]
MNLNPTKHVELIKNAFGKDFYSEKLYEKLRTSPNYHADLDITVYSKTGKAVSTCTGWADSLNEIAEIETVCTHSDYRQKGLARIAMIKCLQKLKEKGFTKAYISSLNEITHNFYDSFTYKNRQKSYEYCWNKSEE